jgi:hypothetical protein
MSGSISGNGGFGIGGNQFNLISGAATSLAARNALGVPVCGTVVTDQPYGAIDDGLGGYFLVTWTHNGTTLSLYNSNCNVTVANTGPNGTAVVTFPGATSGNAATPHADWVGLPIAIAGAGVAGGVLVAQVADFYYNFSASGVATIALNIPAPTPLTASPQQVACPCFTSGVDESGLPSCVGKLLWMNTGGQVPGTAGSPHGNPLQFTATEATISGYTSPFQVTLSAATLGWGQTAAPSRVVWGTNNQAAVVAACKAAIAAGYDTVYFPGKTSLASTRKFCIFDWEQGLGVQTPATALDGALISMLNWVSSGASVFITTNASIADSNSNQNTSAFQQDQLYKSAIPDNAGSIPAPKICIDALTGWPRLATLNAFVVLVVGDSWANGDPSGEGNAVWGAFAQNLQKQNPGKKIYFVNNTTNGLIWNALVQSLAAFSTVTVASLGTVTPDLVCLFLTGGNDGGDGILYTDVMYCVNTVKSWTKANGYPPDICMLTGTYPRSMVQFSANGDPRIVKQEYGSVFQRSFARVRGIPFVDIARHGAFALRGWSEDQLSLRNVYPWPAGTAPVRSNSQPAGYVCPYQCRDFYMVMQLGVSQTGAAFWAAAGTLQLQISPKPDNLLTFSVDGSNNLNTTAQAWGFTVPTPVTIANGSATLTTSGQTTISSSANFGSPSAPNYAIGGSTGILTSGMVGNCLLAPGFYQSNEDWRTYMLGLTNNNIGWCTEGAAVAGTGNLTGTLYWGGQMFTANDVIAATDVVIAGAGAVNHPLTGANSLVTTLASYSTAFSVTLNAVNTQTSLSASTQNVFVGRISAGPGYNLAIAAGSDSGTNALLTIKKTNNHVKIGYCLGGYAGTDIRSYVQNNEKVVWEGEVEIWGGPYNPRFFATSGSVTLTPLYVWIDDRDGNLRKPVMTMMQAFGAGDPVFSSTPFGGDSGHPSHIYLNNIIDEVTATQRLSIGTNYANNFGINTPTTGFSYIIPVNQAFTDLTPAGTLATGTVILPSVFPQGGRLEIFSTQIVTALTITAPSGFTIQGSSVTTIAANGTIAYRLAGTIFTRVQ